MSFRNELIALKQNVENQKKIQLEVFRRTHQEECEKIANAILEGFENKCREAASNGKSRFEFYRYPTTNKTVGAKNIFHIIAELLTKKVEEKGLSVEPEGCCEYSIHYCALIACWH